MKHIFWIVIFMVLVSIEAHGQDTKGNNSFIILLNDKLVRSVSNLTFTSSDPNGKEDSIIAAYYPGSLYFNNIETKKWLYTDVMDALSMTFTCDEGIGSKQSVHNYTVKFDRAWLKRPLIIVKINDLNKKKGTYKYSFEVSGYTFGRYKK